MAVGFFGEEKYFFLLVRSAFLACFMTWQIKSLRFGRRDRKRDMMYDIDYVL